MKRMGIVAISALLVLVMLAGIATVYFTACHAFSAAQVEREWQTTHVAKIKHWGTTQSLEIIPLGEAEASGPEFQAEHGVSYLVKTDSTTILFDLGMNTNASDPSPLQANMQRLGIALDEVQTLVISHNHPDHVGGVSWWRANTFSLGNQQLDLAGKIVYVPEAMSYPGLTPIVADQPQRVAPGVATLGTIPFAEVWQVALFRARNAEQAVAINVAGKGVVLITGCGHQTLPKLIARAQALFDEPIAGIVGGLHFEEVGVQAMEPYIRQVEALDPQLIALSPHDSGEAARQAFRLAFPDAYQEIRIGQPIHFNASLAKHTVVK